MWPTCLPDTWWSQNSTDHKIQIKYKMYHKMTVFIHWRNVTCYKYRVLIVNIHGTDLIPFIQYPYRVWYRSVVSYRSVVIHDFVIHVKTDFCQKRTWNWTKFVKSVNSFGSQLSGRFDFKIDFLFRKFFYELSFSKYWSTGENSSFCFCQNFWSFTETSFQMDNSLLHSNWPMKSELWLVEISLKTRLINVSTQEIKIFEVQSYPISGPLTFRGFQNATYALRNDSSTYARPPPEAIFVILFPSLSEPQARNLISKLEFWTASIDGPARENQPKENISANLKAVQTDV